MLSLHAISGAAISGLAGAAFVPPKVPMLIPFTADFTSPVVFTVDVPFSHPFTAAF